MNQTQTSIRLTFLTNTDNLIHIHTRYASETLTDDIVDDAMDDILLASVYDGQDKGLLLAKKGAVLTTRHIKTLDVHVQ